MSGRRRYHIEEIGNDFGDAPFGSALKSKDYTISGVPVIQGRNIKDNKFIWNQRLYVSEEKFASLKRSHCRAGDLVFPKIGTIGVAAIMPRVEGRNTFLLSTNMMKMSVNKAIADIKYVYYFFCQSQVREYIRATAGGSSQPIFNFTTLKKFEIEVPDLSEQLRVASILSAYDDLIENNTRRIQILEEMARQIYEDWFVRFRFPGHENVRMIKSELGMIPYIWDVVRLEDQYKTGSGGTPSRKNPAFYGGDINWVKTQELNDGFIFESDEKITLDGLNNSSAKMFLAETVLIAMYGATIGALGILASPSSTNQACCAIIKKREPFGFEYAFLSLLVNRSRLIELRAGAAQQNINQVVIKNFKILKPDDETMSAFNHLVNPILKQISLLQKKNDILRRTRDLLLPKLISGEIDVSNFPDPE